MKSLVIGIVFSLILISCAPSAQKTQMKISIGAVTGSANFPGGLFVMGENIQGQKFSKKVPDSDNLIIEIPNGEWSFAAFGWDGTEHFEGNVYCDVKANVNLVGGEFNLNFATTTAKCSHPFYGQKLHSSTNDFLPLTFNTCLDIKGYIQNGEQFDSDVSCSGSGDGGAMNGGAKSVKISMVNYALGENGSVGEKALTSKCYDFSNSKVDTNIKLPFASFDVDMPYVVDTYSDTGCAGDNKVYFFGNGLAVQTENDEAIAFADSVNNKSLIWLHADACVGAQLTNTPFAMGTPVDGNDPRLICTPAQWQAINSDISTYPGAHYELGKDIDFLASNTTIANAFVGTLRGNFHTLSNGNQPLFSKVTSLDNKSVSIRNLNIDSFSITMTDSASSYNRGILINDLYSSGTSNAEGQEISDINITNSSITLNDTSATGSLGGVVGKITYASSGLGTTPTSTNEYGSLRKINADVSVIGDSATAIGLGGLVGRVEGNGGSVGGINLEYNSVGSHDEVTNVYNRATISGKVNVGGLVGQLNNAEIRTGNAAYVDINGQNSIGGLIGLAGDGARVSSSFADVYFEPYANSANIGGIVGKGIDGANLDLDGVVAKVVIPTGTGVDADYLGGIVGLINHTGAPGGLIIRNSKGYLQSEINGKYQGGLIGRHAHTQSTGVNIEGSVAAGLILPETTNPSDTVGTNNSYRGGIAGDAMYLETGFSVVTLLGISGHSYVGGAYGHSDFSGVKKSYIGATGIVGYSDSQVYVGGMAGKVIGASSMAFDSNKIEVGITIPGHVTGVCTTHYCGLLTGFQNQNANNVFNKTIAKGSIFDFGSTNRTIDCSGTFCAEGAASPLEFIENDDATANCTAIASTDFAMNGAICEPVFQTDWKLLGFELDVNSNPNYKSGSIIEPFIIQNAAEWNIIQDKTLYMSKFFKLTNNIDFNNGAFNPIGTTDATSNNDKVFRGGILPDGNQLLNITYTTDASGTPTGGGIFPNTENVQIGFWNDPLVIENLNLTASIPNSGVLGSAVGGHILLQVKNGNITTTAGATAAVGGLVGFVSSTGQDIRIDDSSFEGVLDAGDATGVGAFIGSTQGGAWIRSSFADLTSIYGNNYVGGLIGQVATGPQYEIQYSYVWIDKFSANTGNDFAVAAGSNRSLGSFVGYAEDQGVQIKSSYADISNATLGTDFAAVIGGAYGGTPSGTYTFENSAIIGSNSTPVGAYATGAGFTVNFYSDPQALAEAEGLNYGDDHSDWAFQNGNLLANWQVYGFTNN